MYVLIPPIWEDTILRWVIESSELSTLDLARKMNCRKKSYPILSQPFKASIQVTFSDAMTLEMVILQQQEADKAFIAHLGDI
ncbi:hypothetical protein TNCT_579541 [Trichonephila clavata]|uniref:Uncharacterized protein n=1 Tax=Trichonephila clavata TaxID=2740835 RepID=A0A8X6IVV2_TRICU|nr:hypothetical protein TNCT_579541 [Trichonephila clavata]